MSTDVTANTLFCGPDCGLLENVVLRHDNGIITSISESAPPRLPIRIWPPLPRWRARHARAAAP